MQVTVPVAIVQKAGLENAILAAELRRAGYRKGIDFEIVEYPQRLSQTGDELKFVFLGKHWGTKTDDAFVREVSRPDRPVLVASFHEDLLEERKGPCHLHIRPGRGDERYRWLFSVLKSFV